MRKAKITNWQVVPTDQNKGFVLKGTITEHEGNPQPGEDGLYATSPLKTIDFERGVALSQNTEYTLGEIALEPVVA